MQIGAFSISDILEAVFGQRVREFWQVWVADAVLEHSPGLGRAIRSNHSHRRRVGCRLDYHRDARTHRLEASIARQHSRKRRAPRDMPRPGGA